MTSFVVTLYNKPIERLATVRGAILLHVVLLKGITASQTVRFARNIKATQHVVLMRKIETPEIEFNPLLHTHELTAAATKRYIILPIH